MCNFTFNYTYITVNWLTHLTTGTLTTEYKYNGDGIRITQIANGEHTDYVQDVTSPLPQVLTNQTGWDKLAISLARYPRLHCRRSH